MIELGNIVAKNMDTYQQAVNQDRAIPDARTGLKPIHTKILWEMYVDGIKSSGKYVKCAYMAGQVISRFSEHGDTSAYDALVRLAQPWIQRYPLLDFHGNVGSQFGDSQAAMRYTEAKLTPLAEEFILSSVEEDAIDFEMNFTNTEKEPSTLPATFPGLFCLPTQGIGYACASNFLTFNLTEVCRAIQEYMKSGKWNYLYFDLASGGVIINPQAMEKIAKTGQGSITIDSVYKVDKNKIYFTQFPFNVMIDDIIESIVDACNCEKVDGVKDVRNESGNGRVLVVVECAKDADPANVASKLMASTKLRNSYGINQTALVDKVPVVLSQQSMADIYIAHNLECIRRQYSYRLNKTNERIEVLQGLTKAIDRVDEVINTIRSAKDAKTAKKNLIDNFELTERQADAVLAIKLSSLANYAVIDLQKELDDLTKQAVKFFKVVDNEKERKKVLSKRLDELVKKYGDERRTLIQEKQLSKTVANGDFRKWEILLDEKRRTLSKRQVKEGGKHNSDCVVLSSDKGRVFRVMVSDIPESGITDFTLLDEIVADEQINTVNSGGTQVVMLTTGNKIKRLCLDEFEGNVRNKAGMNAIKLPLGDRVIWCGEIKPEHKSINVIDIGEYYSSFPVDEVPLQKKTSAGVTIGKPAFDEIYAIQLSNEEASGHRGGKFKKGHLLQ